MTFKVPLTRKDITMIDSLMEESNLQKRSVPERIRDLCNLSKIILRQNIEKIEDFYEYLLVTYSNNELAGPQIIKDVLFFYKKLLEELKKGRASP